MFSCEPEEATTKSVLLFVLPLFAFAALVGIVLITIVMMTSVANDIQIQNEDVQPMYPLRELAYYLAYESENYSSTPFLQRMISHSPVPKET